MGRKIYARKTRFLQLSISFICEPGYKNIIYLKKSGFSQDYFPGLLPEFSSKFPICFERLLHIDPCITLYNMGIHVYNISNHACRKMFYKCFYKVPADGRNKYEICARSFHKKRTADRSGRNLLLRIARNCSDSRCQRRSGAGDPDREHDREHD